MGLCAVAEPRIKPQGVSTSTAYISLFSGDYYDEF